MRMVPLALTLMVAVGIAFLVFGAWGGGSSAATTSRPELEPEQREADAEVLKRVKQIAWDHREIDAPLADQLIGYLNARENDLDLHAVRNEVAEIAWRARDQCPDLSVIVRDLARP